jgi:apolipoprotein N-acyltransferase
MAEVVGKIRLINAEQQVSASFKKRELVVTTEGQYPQHIIIDFTQDKCAVLDGYKAGEDVKVSINIGGRIWVNPQGEEKYFNSISGWRIERDAPGQHSPAAANGSAVNQYEAKNNPKQVANNDEDIQDLPF